MIAAAPSIAAEHLAVGVAQEARTRARAAAARVHDRIDAELHTVGLAHFSRAIAQRMELIERLAGTVQQ